jgi:hypothetical protein
LEKAGKVIESTCFMLAHARRIESDLPDQDYDLRHHFYYILYNATKLYCDAVRDLHGAESYRLASWSPELPDYLFAHPEMCEETLDIIGSEGYRDPYYDDREGS